MAVRVDRDGEADGTNPEVLAALSGQGRAWAEDWRVLRVEVWTREVLPPPATTAEAKLRAAPDRFIERAVFAHFAREEDARAVAGERTVDGDVGIYRLLCELRSD